MDLKTFVADGWRDHADNARGVADRLGDGLALVDEEVQIAALAGLAHHVYGEHLGAWHEGIAYLERLSRLAGLAPSESSAASLRRCTASLALAGEIEDARPTLSPSDRIRVGAMAAASLAERDVARAITLFEQTLELARTTPLDADDPANRSLAVTGNNLASALERKQPRSDDERALMVLAAQAGRHYWAIAGGWLEIERAEYRLAMTWMQAGELARAREHAQACLEIVEANGGHPLETFFGWEALGQVERAAGNRTGHAHAFAMARQAFEHIPAEDQTWCRESLTALEAPAA